MLSRRAFLIVGSSFLVIGLVLLVNSVSGITGFAVFGESDVVVGSVAAVWFVIAGLVVLGMAGHAKSRIKDSGLIRLAEEATRDQTVQRDMNHLQNELYRGHSSPGLPPKKLFGNVSYLRSKNGARLFYRPDGHGGHEILGKSSKKNEGKVIDKLEELYGAKAKKRSA